MELTNEKVKPLCVENIYLVHLVVFVTDGNDKLERWGFYIHRFVDGFIRKLFWLVEASSNNDPIFTSNYFLRCIKKYRIAPNLIRMVKGRENIYCEDLQWLFTGREDSIRRFY